MTRVRGPLFSVGARGTLGGAVSFKQSISGARVVKKPVPSDRRSGAQVANRGKFQEAIAYWRSLHEHEKEFYNYLGNQVGITGYDFCIGSYMEGSIGG